MAAHLMIGLMRMANQREHSSSPHTVVKVGDEPEAGTSGGVVDQAWMQAAIEAAWAARRRSSPNPWVGAVVVPAGPLRNGQTPFFVGATQEPGGDHAEVVALREAGSAASGSTLYVTLEPCDHRGRTGPCTEAIIAAGVSRVVVGIVDPDRAVCGRGVARLKEAGIEVEVGSCAGEVEKQLAPYITHRTKARPWVVLKLAATMDGRIAAPDGSSKWITGPQARRDVHELRADSDAVLVGAATVRADDPELTVRDITSPRQPLRVVLGSVEGSAKVLPALCLNGEIPEILGDLARRGVLQLLVEGGAQVAHDFHVSGLVDRYALYMAPVLLGGADGLGMFASQGAGTLSDAWRGHIVGARRLGEDLRVDLEP